MVYWSRHSRDVDGRLHSKSVPITRSGVFFYRASELPDLSGNPNRAVAVYRPADEVKRALMSMCGIPIYQDIPKRPVALTMISSWESSKTPSLSKTPLSLPTL